MIDPEGRVEFGEVTASVEAERDHLRRALEWLAREFAAHDKLACPERCGGVCVFWMSEEDEEAGTPCEERVTDDMPRGCWITAALAATKEAPDEPVDA